MTYIADPDGAASLPPCDCSHAGERHRSASKGTMSRACEMCGCREYVPADPNKPATRLTLGGLSQGRRPPETPL